MDSDVVQSAPQGTGLIVVLFLAGESLPAGLRGHPLSGGSTGHRDLHIQPDWILIYAVIGDELHLARTGTHSDLFD
jgi:mRNA interferase YafQ